MYPAVYDDLSVRRKRWWEVRLYPKAEFLRYAEPDYYHRRDNPGSVGQKASLMDTISGSSDSSILDMSREELLTLLEE